MIIDAKPWRSQRSECTEKNCSNPIQPNEKEQQTNKNEPIRNLELDVLKVFIASRTRNPDERLLREYFIGGKRINNVFEKHATYSQE